MFQMLMLLSALLPAHNFVVEGVTTATSGSGPALYKEFTFSMEDFKNEKSREDVLTVWRSKMVDVENFLRETLLAQNGEININTVIIAHDVTTTASNAVQTGTIISNHMTTPIASSIGGTSTIISSDATSLAPIATSIAGTSTATSNDPTSFTPIAISIVDARSITSSDATWPTRLVTTILETSTIAADHATLSTPVTTANVHKTVTTPSECEFILSDICYWSYGERTNDMNFTEAQQVCADKESVPAYFPTELSYNKTMDSLREKIKAVRKTWANAYTGVVIDAQTLTVTYPDTKGYIKWHPGYPTSRNDCTSVVLRFKSEPKSKGQGMRNFSPSTTVFGVVCQRNLN